MTSFGPERFTGSAPSVGLAPFSWSLLKASPPPVCDSQTAIACYVCSVLGCTRRSRPAESRGRGIFGCDATALGQAIEPKREAEGGAAAAQERIQRRGHNAVTALRQLGTQALAAIGHHQHVAKANRIGGE